MCRKSYETCDQFTKVQLEIFFQVKFNVRSVILSQVEFNLLPCPLLKDKYNSKRVIYDLSYVLGSVKYNTKIQSHFLIILMNFTLS